MPLTVPFPGNASPPRAEVGGKAHSLIRMVAAGLPVPPGVVLTAAFFTPWFETLRRLPAWSALAGATPDGWTTPTRELKALCPDLPLTEEQREALRELREHLPAPDDGVTFAVRSSSPEEDLESASFAGGYETRLGVLAADLEEAIRHCFASSLDERVLVYKREHGFDVPDPRIAVVVQKQIDSEVAGVGFSINPTNNDYDEVVIDANWGLGETVVSGRVSPDHFVMDKNSGRVVEAKIGAKQVTVRLAEDGGTVELNGHRSHERTLDDRQLGELTETLSGIEELYGKPMDVEWAYADGKLHVLQARPITRWVPLPPEMMTKPGERRRLYADTALSKGMAMNAPISPLGLDWMEKASKSLLDRFVSPHEVDVTPEGSFLFFCAGGRMYSNLSNIFWLASPKRMARASATDTLMAEIIASVDADIYRSAVRPWSRLGMLRTVPKILWRLRRSLWNTVWAMIAPERAYRTYRREVEAFESGQVTGLDDLPLDEIGRIYAESALPILFDVTMPALMAGLSAMGSVDRVVGGKSATSRELAEKLKLGFTDNVVVEMGISLHRLAQKVSPADFDALPLLIERVEKREMPAEFLAGWDAFVAKYGWRGPLEMDLASPRYGDDPGLALRQMSFMATADGGFDPEAAHLRNVEERRRAFETLSARSGPLRRALLRRVHRIIDRFAGTRDTPKHLNLLSLHVLRKRIVKEGRRLVEEGRLDAADDVFGLTFSDLGSAAADPGLDLRSIRTKRMQFLKLLESRVTSFPLVIDSRGRILRPPPRPEQPGEMSGTAVSPGIATGTVKVLRDPREKPVHEGDILVAYTTDPGWTPLFVNAAAVVLEVGGILQHGAVVAREYGKPCVAGIDRVTARLHDGQRVEVDGTAGVIRLLP